MRTEVFKVTTVVKNKETLFIGIFAVHLVGAGQSLAQARSTTDHLPEFRLGTHLFEEYKVNALRHIDAGIHHVDRHCNNRLFLWHFEIVDDRLRICVIADHSLGKCAFESGVQFIESLQNELCMAFILGEDNCFPQSVTTGDAYTAFHHILQYSIHSGFIKHEFV